MLELDGTIWLRAGEDNWGGRGRIELLAAIGQTGSITAGAKAVGLSYKAAWDAIDTMNNLAGEPLVVVATKSLDATLATWRTQTKFFVTVAVLSIGLLVLTLYLIFRQVTHRLSCVCLSALTSSRC